MATKKHITLLVDGGDNAQMPKHNSGQNLFLDTYEQLMECFNKLAPQLPPANWWMEHGRGVTGKYYWRLATSAPSAAVHAAMFTL